MKCSNWVPKLTVLSVYYKISDTVRQKKVKLKIVNVKINKIGKKMKVILKKQKSEKKHRRKETRRKRKSKNYV